MICYKTKPTQTFHSLFPPCPAIQGLDKSCRNTKTCEEIETLGYFLNVSSLVIRFGRGSHWHDPISRRQLVQPFGGVSVEHWPVRHHKLVVQKARERWAARQAQTRRRRS